MPQTNTAVSRAPAGSGLVLCSRDSRHLDSSGPPGRPRASAVHFPQPRIVAVRSVILNHTHHNRGQFCAYLHADGEPVPWVSGPKADVNPFAGRDNPATCAADRRIGASGASRSRRPHSSMIGAPAIGDAMKPLPLLLLNALVSVCIVIAYDQIRGDPVQAPGSEQVSVGDTSDLEKRIGVLESARRPLLESAPADMTARFREIDERIDSMMPRPGSKEAAPTPIPTSRPGMIIENEDEMSQESVAEFKRIINQVKREERTKRIRKRTDKALASLELALDESTRQKLARAYADFEQRRDEVWREVKRDVADGAGDADWAVVISDTQARLAGEFRDRIVDFVPPGDAGEVATALFPASGSK